MNADPSHPAAPPVGAAPAPALPPPCSSPAGPESDARITALCGEAIALETVWTAEIAALDREGAYPGDPTPEQEAADAVVRAKGKRIQEIVDLLCGLPSATLDGTRAKASVVVAFNSGCTGAASCEATPELARIVCEELARATAQRAEARA